MAGLGCLRGSKQPFSAEYEIAEGTFQLSAYANKAGKFFEVVVDDTTLKVAKYER